jgi:ribosomal protein L11 methyltransferase
LTFHESLNRRTYSRLVVPRRAGDDLLLGLISLFDPLGFVEDGRNLVACFRDADAARRAGAALSMRRIQSELVTEIPEGDPLQSFRAASRPFAVGRRLWIDPGDPSDSAAPEGRIALRLPASRAFGTGSHASTRLALLALEDEALSGVRLLDVGTGSGVLALAAVGLGAERAFGYDADLDAVLVARENLRRHAWGGRIALAAAPPRAVAGVFEVVVANLLPEEILPARSEILAAVAPRGRLIVSGIPLLRETELVERLRGRRWSLVSRRAEEEWACFTLRRA